MRISQGRALKWLLAFTVLHIIVLSTNAYALMWNYEWDYIGTSVFVYDENVSSYRFVDVTDAIQTRGYLEGYARDASNCGSAFSSGCFEIKNFQFTLTDAAGETYLWNVSNKLVANPWIYPATGGLIWDTHLNAPDDVNFGTIHPDHMVYTQVGYYGYAETGFPQTTGYDRSGGHFYGSWIAVPEPSSLDLLGVSLMGLIVWRWKRRLTHMD